VGQYMGGDGATDASYTLRRVKKCSQAPNNQHPSEARHPGGLNIQCSS